MDRSTLLTILAFAAVMGTGRAFGQDGIFMNMVYYCSPEEEQPLFPVTAEIKLTDGDSFPAFAIVLWHEGGELPRGEILYPWPTNPHTTDTEAKHTFSSGTRGLEFTPVQTDGEDFWRATFYIVGATGFARVPLRCSRNSLFDPKPLPLGMPGTSQRTR